MTRHNEEWKDIEGYEGIYQISNMGRVKSLSRKIWNGVKFFQSSEKILKPGIDSVGYCVVSLYKNDGKAQTVRVHRLVAKAFIPNPNAYRVINHIDANRTNNNVTNLEWCTHKQNSAHAIKIGSMNKMMHPVQVVETGQVFPSLSECARQMSEYNVDVKHISDCLRGKLKTHAGFHFKYA